MYTKFDVMMSFLSVCSEEAVLMVADWMDASEMAKRFTTSKSFVIHLNSKTNNELIYSLNKLSNYKKFGYHKFCSKVKKLLA